MQLDTVITERNSLNVLRILPFNCLTVLLGLAEVELSSLLTKSMVTCFGFVTKAVLIAHQCFVCY